MNPKANELLNAHPSSLRGVFASLRDDFRRRFRSSVRFYAPGFIKYENCFFKSDPKHFPSISVTGRSCSLNCPHCSVDALHG